ncbi:3-isopropylmalate dehydratase small subunit [Brucella gallinifaecis]|nr:3-isopropylmalate dehydratase small subunit [Brucella gallinifaecis]
MQPFKHLNAIACPIEGTDINTDQILPGRFMQKPRINYGDYFFHDLRPSTDKSADDNTVFAPFRQRYRNAAILVCDRNFGCGSSREQAVHAAYDYGIRVVIAPSLGENFQTNCFKNGLLAITLDEANVVTLRDCLQSASEPQLSIDLPEQIICIPGTNITFRYEIDAFSKASLLSGMDDLDLTLSLLSQLAEFENKQSAN